MQIDQKISLVSSIAQAVSTIALVGVTIYYAYQTKKTVDVMDRNSKADFLPIVMPGIYRVKSNSKTLVINLVNVGKGLAKRPVKIIFPGVAPIYINSIAPMSISPTDESDVTINYDIDYILSLSEEARKITIEYQDIFGRVIKTEAPLKEANTFGPEGNARGITWDAWNPIIP